MKNKFIEWYKKKYSKRQRILSLIFLAPFFTFIFPFGLRFFSLKIDRFFGLPLFLPIPLNYFPGILLLAIGFYLALWAIVAEFKIGEGTPLPLMPTQKLVIKAPYTFCRNPMSLGTGFLLLGFGIIFNSPSFILISICLLFLLLTYIKNVEEKELEARFGQNYVDYKKRVPFFIPRFRI
jgi:protein-S-isoprenylcysteine O-methyltransferase Ste14